MPFTITRTRTPSTVAKSAADSAAGGEGTSINFGTTAKSGADTATATQGATVLDETPAGGVTLFGLHCQDPDTGSAAASFANFTDLDPLRGLSAAGMVDYTDNEFATIGGYSEDPFFHLGSTYLSSNVFTLNSLATKLINKYGRLHLLISTNPWTDMANGTYDTQLGNLLTAIGNHQCWLSFENEPEGDVGVKGTRQNYCDAFAHMAKYIIDHRGTKPIYPTTDYTQGSLTNASGVPISTATQWDCSQELIALGVDPATDVVMAPHGYHAEPQTLLFTERMGPVYDLLESWGFRRFAFGEGAAKQRSTTHFLAMDTWMRNMAGECVSRPLEFVNWFHSGGSGGSIQLPDGNWIAGSPYNNVGLSGQSAGTAMALDNRNKALFADITHYKGALP